MTQAGMVGRIDGPPTQAMIRADGVPVEWRVADGLVAYEDALSLMDDRVDAIRRGALPELIWLVQHPPLYTAGTSTVGDLPEDSVPVHRSGRGGQITYHGPGQRVAYVMLDLQRRTADVRAFVASLELWLIETLATFEISGERREERVGVWVPRPDKAPGADGTPAEDKIAAIGIRVRRWITFHGISLNVHPDLSHYAAIAPCGISEHHYGVTSFADLGKPVTMAAVDTALHKAFSATFGATRLP